MMMIMTLLNFKYIDYKNGNNTTYTSPLFASCRHSTVWPSDVVSGPVWHKIVRHDLWAVVGPLWKLHDDSCDRFPSAPFNGHSATSNNMKLVHWPLTGGLLHLVQWEGDWGRPSSLHQMWQPIHQRPVYQSSYCCIMVRCSAVLMCSLKC